VIWHRRLAGEPTDLAQWSLDARRFVHDALLGMPSESWCALDDAGFERWLGAAHGLAAQMLALLPPEPSSDQDRTETSALARQQDRPALKWARQRCGWGTFARVVARVVELVDCLTQIKSPALAPSKNEPHAATGGVTRRGSASVETARGRLVHEVELGGEGRVERYRVVAPTDVNFQSDGPCARALARLEVPTPEAAVAAANRVVLGFDPCVPWQVSARAA
jgi:hypothetical protein